MRPVEAVLQALEAAHAHLVGAHPGDFPYLQRLVRNRALAIQDLLPLIENSELTKEQLDRANRVCLGGSLTLERIRGERQIVRKELSLLSQRGRVIAGYQYGSAQD